MHSTIALLVMVFPLATSVGVEFFEPVAPPRRCQVMAHSGAFRAVPPNSAAAIEQAAADLLEWIEVDIRRAKDGQHVLIHDESVDSTTNGHGKVSELTLAQLNELDAGSWFSGRLAGTRIATLPECLGLAKGRINLYLDCKDIDPARLVAEIQKAEMERQAIVFGEPAILKQVRTHSGGKVAVLLKWRPGETEENLLDEVSPAIVEIDVDVLSPAICEQMHQRGIKVQANTLGKGDEPKAWQHALDCNVDYAQTDLPGEFLARALFQRVKKRPVQFALHRGASRYAPENTAPAFETAFRLGADYVEFDVRTTRDGGWFLLHDATLDRTTNGHGPISRQTSAAVEQLDAGSWLSQRFPGVKLLSLDRFLDLVKGNALLYFDAKAIAPDALAAALTRHDLVEQAVVFQGPDYLAKLKSIEPRIKRMPPLYRPEQLDRLVERVAPYSVDVTWESLSPELIARCHAAGVRVFSDAKEDHVQGHLKAMRWGIDLIQTDHPMQLLRAIEIFSASQP